MEFEIRYISFYVIQVDGKDEQANKQYKHFQTLDTEEFENSELKDFLDGELKKSSSGKPNAIRNRSRCRRKSAASSQSRGMSLILIRTTICFTKQNWRRQRKNSMN